MPESSAGNTRGLIEARRAACEAARASGSLPRGIPAASLKPIRTSSHAPNDDVRMSSAGNTRGLIEAAGTSTMGACGRVRLPRGIPAASLKRVRRRRWGDAGLVFRGEYPRPH